MFVGQSKKTCFRYQLCQDGESSFFFLRCFPPFAHAFLVVTYFVVCCMDVGASGGLQKKTVRVHVNSQWNTVVVASIVSWCEVSIGGVESPVTFEVGVRWVFFELVADRSLEYSMDSGEVDSSTVKCCIPHTRDRCSLTKVLHPSPSCLWPYLMH